MPFPLEVAATLAVQDFCSVFAVRMLLAFCSMSSCILVAVSAVDPRLGSANPSH